MRIFIGVAWPYASGPIHLGQVAGSLLAPDIFARYHRLRDRHVLMVSGSDQHGTPITVVAEREGTTPENVAEKYHIQNSRDLAKFGISFDIFFATTHETHKKVVWDMFLRLYERGYIYKKTMIAPYCSRCLMFLPDRYVEGECPHCGFKNARGDQCDECGKLLDPEDLVNSKCKLCSREPMLQKTEHFFFKLTEFQRDLEDYVSDKSYWRANTINFTKNLLKAGLRDRPITRDLTWGVEIPLPGYDSKRIYVWFEAVIGYLSASKQWAISTGNPDEWRNFWENKDVKHYYFLGKDNIPFHTIIWPAMLMGYGGLNLPYDVPANEFLRMGMHKFSKSRGHAIWLYQYLEEYDPDPLRYYLTIHMPENHDTTFDWDEFVSKNNTDLVGTLGNFIHRVLSFTYKNFGSIPSPSEFDLSDEKALQKIEKTYENVEKFIEHCQFKNAITEVMNLAHFGNKYLNDKAPWKTLTTNPDKCKTTMYIACRMIKALSVLVAPFMPFTAKKLQSIFGLENLNWDDGKKNALYVLNEPYPLFKKIEIEDKHEDYEKLVDDLSKLDLRIGTIIKIENHPSADKLYVLTVHMGTDTKISIAGLKEFYHPNVLLNKNVVVVTNLESAKIRGIISECMLLAAVDENNVSLLVPEKEVSPGSLITTSTTKKVSFKDFKKIELRTGTVIDWNKDIAKVDIKDRIIDAFCKSRCINKKVVVFLSTKIKNKGLVLAVDDVLITVDTPIGNGVRIE